MNPLSAETCDENLIALWQRRLTVLSKRLQKNQVRKADAGNPLSVKDDLVFWEGSHRRRKRIVLAGPACSVGFCTMCGLFNEGIGRGQARPKTGDVMAQFDLAFDPDKANGCDVLTIYTNGNFFADKELKPEVRRHIYDRVANSPVSTVVVESLPQFVDQQALQEAKQGLAGKALVVAMGLQSANDLVRNLAINSPCQKPVFEQAVGLLQDQGMMPLAFLMVKPPFLTEQEAIEDTLQSLFYLSKLGVRNSVLCPLQLTPHTIAHVMFQKGLLKPLWYRSLHEIFTRSAAEVSDHRTRFATYVVGGHEAEDVFDFLGCEWCQRQFENGLKQKEQSWEGLLSLNGTCTCQNELRSVHRAEENLFGHMSLLQRVEWALGQSC